MKVLVCGGRDFWDYAYARFALDTVRRSLGPFTEIMHGKQRGADRLADRYARSHGIPVHSFPANWQQYGPTVGPSRNKQMLDDGQPDLVVALPGGKDTVDMVKQARAKGVRVLDDFMYMPGMMRS